MILAAHQQTKSTVRIVTDKGSRYVVGILHGYTSETVTVKASEKSRTLRICNEKGQTIRYISQ